MLLLVPQNADTKISKKFMRTDAYVWKIWPHFSPHHFPQPNWDARGQCTYLHNRIKSSKKKNWPWPGNSFLNTPSLMSGWCTSMRHHFYTRKYTRNAEIYICHSYVCMLPILGQICPRSKYHKSKDLKRDGPIYFGYSLIITFINISTS